MLVAAHAQPVDQQAIGGLVVGQSAPLDLVADDGTQHVDAAVDVAIDAAGERGDDGALRRLVCVRGVLVHGAVLIAGVAGTIVQAHRHAEAGAHPHQMVQRDQAMDGARIGPERCRRRIVDRAQPAFLDQPADDRAGDRLRHRPAGCRPVRGTERAVALEQYAVGSSDEHAIGAG